MFGYRDFKSEDDLIQFAMCSCHLNQDEQHRICRSKFLTERTLPYVKSRAFDSCWRKGEIFKLEVLHHNKCSVVLNYIIDSIEDSEREEGIKRIIKRPDFRLDMLEQLIENHNFVFCFFTESGYFFKKIMNLKNVEYADRVKLMAVLKFSHIFFSETRSGRHDYRHSRYNNRDSDRHLHNSRDHLMKLPNIVESLVDIVRCLVTNGKYDRDHCDKLVIEECVVDDSLTDAMRMKAAVVIRRLYIDDQIEFSTIISICRTTPSFTMTLLTVLFNRVEMSYEFFSKIRSVVPRDALSNEMFDHLLSDADVTDADIRLLTGHYMLDIATFKLDDRLKHLIKNPRFKTNLPSMYRGKKDVCKDEVVALLTHYTDVFTPCVSPIEVAPCAPDEMYVIEAKKVY